MQIVLASTNPHKLDELSELFRDVPGYEFILGPRLEVEETGTTFLSNALIKARAFMEATGLPSLADDSGLVVEALGGRPGVYSARYAPTDPERIKRLLGELEGIGDRRAAFVCAMALVFPDGREVTVEERSAGIISETPDGQGGFGYDPIFYVPELQRTFAALTPEEKGRISHRGRATAALKRKLAQAI